jgi:uncharacterized glyoxalase superfamily protein PhnB
MLLDRAARDHRTMEPVAGLHAYLSYRDASEGLRWLHGVGFHVVSRQEGPDGTILHAEVRLGDVVLMVASADAAYEVPSLVGRSTGGGLYLWLPQHSDVDNWHVHAISAGAHEVIAPEDTDWGTRRSRVLDPEGHEWSVGTYRPGSPW